MKKSFAFTLAEVLITLGIIGVVAAMTLPALVQKKTNSEVEAKLKKIYSAMNQAILLSEIDNGPKEYWSHSCGEDTDIDCETYYNKYFLKYLKTYHIKNLRLTGGITLRFTLLTEHCLLEKPAMTTFSFQMQNTLMKKLLG